MGFKRERGLEKIEGVEGMDGQRVSRGFRDESLKNKK